MDKYFTEKEKEEANVLISGLNSTLVRNFGKSGELPREYFFNL